MRIVSEAAARRYARAVLEVAVAQKSGPAVAEDLRQAAAVFAAHPALGEALLHPALPLERKKKILQGLWGGGQPLVLRLLELMAERDRLALLPAVAAAFTRLWNEREGILQAEAAVPGELEAGQRTALAAAIAKATGMKVELTTLSDPALLGGVVLRMGGRVYDGSVRGRLRALKRQLTAAQ